MKTLKALHNRTETAKNKIITAVKKKFPIITDLSIYSHRNISIASEHFSIDMYENNSYTEDNIRMNCKMSMSEIPTEEQAIAQVKAMHTERKAFIKAMTHVRDNILNDCINEDN